MIVLSVFFVLLAVAYVTTARREAVLTTLNLIKASTRDTVAFFYKYAILPVILIGAAALLCVAVFFAHRWYSDQKQKES
ncbi:hypothetical protein, partial [Halostella sp. PRR32]|uniref:hypothetical protein n=1 Tax=Halostella sp. PRR32 TaxID=3098147 RepID=UPI002B1D91FF